jgi:uncharacterized protein with HEPN domain
MQLEEQARVNLWDIREAAREIAGVVRGVQFEEFEKNKVLRYAVERQLHMIGEVAAHIAPQFCKNIPKLIGINSPCSVISLPLSTETR